MAYNAATRTFDTIDDLIRQGGTTNARVNVLGYNTVGDGGGGTFYWDATNNTGTNGGTIIQVTKAGTSGAAVIATGRYVRYIRTDKVNVKWFGAFGDGVTDDTVAVQAAATYCKSLNGAATKPMLYFPSGEYLVGRITVSGVNHISGCGFRTVIRGKAGEDIFYWSNTGEAGYIAPVNVLVEKMRIVVSAATDVSGNYVRISLGGQRIGNVAIHYPGAPGLNGLMTDKVIIVSTNSSVSNRSCAIFASGPLYKYNGGTVTDISGIDFGIIVGASELNPLLTTKAVTYDQSTGTFTTPNTYTTSQILSVIYDTNDGSIADILPRTAYFVVNPTGTTFQLSLTSMGAPIVGAMTGTPALFVMPAGTSSVEYACDEWSWQELITRAQRCSFSVANLAYGAFGTWSCQSSRRAYEILNFPSVTRAFSNQLFFTHNNNEGPLDTTYMNTKEYIKIEGRFIYTKNTTCRAGNANYITLNTTSCVFDGMIVDGTNSIVVTGDNNTLNSVAIQSKEAGLINTGNGNQISWSKDDSGSDAQKFIPFKSDKSLARDIGGYFPDSVIKGTNPYLSDNALYYQANAMVWFAGTPVLKNDDTSLFTNGYVTFTGAQTVSLRYPYGSNKYTISAGKQYPRGKWKLVAYVRSPLGTQNLTLAFQSIVPSGTTSNSVTSVTSAWTSIFLDLDHTAIADGTTAQFNITSASTGFDIAYFVVIPIIGTSVLGTGTADNTTFLRGDGIWTTASGNTIYTADDTITSARTVTLPNAASSLQFVSPIAAPNDVSLVLNNFGGVISANANNNANLSTALALSTSQGTITTTDTTGNNTGGLTINTSNSSINCNAGTSTSAGISASSGTTSMTYNDFDGSLFSTLNLNSGGLTYTTSDGVTPTQHIIAEPNGNVTLPKYPSGALLSTNLDGLIGSVSQEPAIANIAIAPTASDYNAVLQVLRNLGLIAP